MPDKRSDFRKRNAFKLLNSFDVGVFRMEQAIGRSANAIDVSLNNASVMQRRAP